MPQYVSTAVSVNSNSELQAGTDTGKFGPDIKHPM